jgi:uracil-DNA glycosylase
MPSHLAPLRQYAAVLRSRHGAVPDVDPGDGGTQARLLILLETPGPHIGKTGIVSADNPSGTGRNLRRFLGAAGIPRHERVIWNAVPWVIHGGGPNRAPRIGEIRAGLAELPGFLAVLPRLEVAVLAGRVAGLAAEVVKAARPGTAVLLMPHPSPTYVCTSPDVSRRIEATLAEAAALLGCGTGA